jgi:hypothetical protein
MLWADTHIPSECVHVTLLENSVPINESLTLSRLEHTSHHLDSCGFASTVMAQESENLTFVHPEVDAVNCFVAIGVLFL